MVSDYFGSPAKLCVCEDEVHFTPTLCDRYFVPSARVVASRESTSPMLAALRRGSPPHSDVLRQALTCLRLEVESVRRSSLSAAYVLLLGRDASEAGCETAIAASEAFPSGARGIFLPSLSQRREKASEALVPPGVSLGPVSAQQKQIV